MSTLSAWVGGRVLFLLAQAAAAGQGTTFPQDSALQIWPDRPRHFRKPDAMYFAPGRISLSRLPNPLDVAPSIVVEVISPNEIGSRIELKTREYLEAGVPLVWVIYPETQSMHVYRPGGSAAYLGAEDTLTGEDVFPEFSVRVADLFPPADSRMS